MRDNLGDRMKAYEKAQTVTFMPTLPIIVRVDGKAFHTYTKRMGFKKPFDQSLRDYMNSAAIHILDEAQGAKLAYIQSDEITIVLVQDEFESQPWFGGVKRKIETICASKATVGFNQSMAHETEMEGNSVLYKWAEFDARAFQLPFHEVFNVLHWRILDAERNSIQMLARSHFSHKECNGLNNNQLQDKLFTEKGVNWNNIPEHFKRGNVILSNGDILWNIPRITDNKEWWHDLIYRDCVYYEQ